MKENQRKCMKCGRSPSDDPTVKLYRFPLPGIRNTLRCELWAKFCFPKMEQEKLCSAEFQKKLYSEHRMICDKHFKKTAFIDFTLKTLHKFAVPEDEHVKINLQQAGATKQLPQGTWVKKVVIPIPSVMDTVPGTSTALVTTAQEAHKKVVIPIPSVMDTVPGTSTALVTAAQEAHKKVVIPIPSVMDTVPGTSTALVTTAQEAHKVTHYNKATHCILPFWVISNS
ncbi:hypothetical protein CASFOL_043159 [Castilleja foliolosa]|uniref:THAP-type domain-containing protein n=1 Tax=Castilleja foliolosa TaxID=1961234 RepID=A0ABD3B780_9LAMI